MSTHAHAHLRPTHRQTISVSPSASFPFSTGITGQCIATHASLQSDDFTRDAFFNIAVDSVPNKTSPAQMPASLFLLPFLHNNKILSVVQIFSIAPLQVQAKTAIAAMMKTISNLLETVEASHLQQAKASELISSLASVQSSMSELSNRHASDMECLECSRSISSFFHALESPSLEDVMQEISSITSSLFSSEFSTLYKLDGASLLTYCKNEKVFADLRSSIHGRCLSANNIIRLSKEDVEDLGNVALDFKFERITHSMMLVPVTINKSEATGCWGILEVSNPKDGSNYSSKDEEKLLRWSQHVSAFLMFYKKYEATLDTISVVTEEKNSMFDAIKSFNAATIDVNHFLLSAHGHAEAAYGAKRATVYILDPTSDELYFLCHRDNSKLVRISASAAASIPGSVVKSSPPKTSRFTAKNDQHRLLMNAETSLLYFSRGHMALADASVTSSGRITDVTVICAPILLGSSTPIAVLELVLAESARPRPDISEAAERYAAVLAGPLSRYLDVKRTTQLHETIISELQAIDEALISFSNTLASREQLQSIEEDVSTIVPTFFEDAETASLYITNPSATATGTGTGTGTATAARELRANLPLLQTIKLPSSALPARAYEEKCFVTSCAGHVTKFAIPIMRAAPLSSVSVASSPPPAPPIAVLQVVLCKDSTTHLPLSKRLQTTLNSIISLLYSNLTRIEKKSDYGAATELRLSQQLSARTELEDTIKRMQFLAELSAEISLPDTDTCEFIDIMCSRSASFMNADRANFYLVDESEERKELFTLSAGGAEVRTPYDSGIPGHVAFSRIIVNVPDAYRDPRFSRENDAKTGYTTKSVLCGPFLNESGQTVGVLQLTNKRDGIFNVKDEELLAELIDQVGRFVVNSVKFISSNNKKQVEDCENREHMRSQLDASERHHREVLAKAMKEKKEMMHSVETTRALLDIASSFGGDLSEMSIFEEAAAVAARLLQSQHASLFLVDSKSHELYGFIKAADEFRMPLLSGVGGFVVSTSQVLHLPNAHDDPRFNKEFDRRSGFHTKSVLCSPVCNPRGEIVGVLHVINKVPADEEKTDFTEADKNLLLHLARIVGGALERASTHGDKVKVLSDKLEAEKTVLFDANQDKLQLQRENRLMQVAETIGSDSKLTQLFESIVAQIPALVNAERATLFLYNKTTNELFSRTTSNEGGEFRFSASNGLAGYAATTGTVVNVGDAYKDHRFNENFDRTSGFTTRQVLVAPIFDRHNHSVVGVLQVINCTSGGKFDENSEKLIARLNAQLELAISRCLKHEEESENAANLLEKEHNAVETLEKIHEREQKEIAKLKQDILKQNEDKAMLEKILNEARSHESELEKALQEQSQREASSAERMRAEESNYKEKLLQLENELNKEKLLEQELLLEKSKMADKIERDKKLDLLTTKLASDLDINSLFEQVAFSACDLINADRASLFLVSRDDPDKPDLWTFNFTSATVHGAREVVRLPLTSGIVGHCACTGELINIEDASADVRFDRSYDLKTGFVTRTILCCPIYDEVGSRSVAGVIQVINKRGDAKFSNVDEETLGSFNERLSRAISLCNLFGRTQSDLSRQLAFEKEKEKELEEKLKEREDDLISKLAEKDRELAQELQREQELEEDLQAERNLQRVGQALSNNIGIQELFDEVCEHACDLMKAERATLFLIDRNKGEIWSQVAHGSNEIRLPLGDGIAGFVATTGQTVNIADAYQDRRFSRDVDRRSGYKTNTILCAPVCEEGTDAIGVLQIINKHGGAFDDKDEDLVKKLGSYTFSAIIRCQRQKNEVSKEEKLREELRRERTLMKMTETIANDYKMRTLFDQVCESACDFMKADRASLFLVDIEKGELWSMVAVGSEQMRFPMGTGIAGFVAMSGETVNIRDAYQDKRFNSNFDRKSGYRTNTILCGAIQADGGDIVGVLQLINKEGNGAFNDEDEDIMANLCDTVGGAIQRCQEYNGLQTRLIGEQEEKTLLRQELDRERLLQHMLQMIAKDMKMQTLFDQVCNSACHLMSADRATLFLIDRATNEIWSQVAHGSQEIRCQIGVGIAGEFP